ncbi:unnamed protein product [Moneuplotes crassus]|uniref:Uncharacterized protein n=1 Tax=Euplotes crassus TaxID=5936 RepID=A0AAD1U1I2_EUPCR|nr:unnamed protein product [Moneuplotes crassus]
MLNSSQHKKIKRISNNISKVYLTEIGRLVPPQKSLNGTKSSTKYRGARNKSHVIQSLKNSYFFDPHVLNKSDCKNLGNSGKENQKKPYKKTSLDATRNEQSIGLSTIAKNPKARENNNKKLIKSFIEPILNNYRQELTRRVLNMAQNRQREKSQTIKHLNLADIKKYCCKNNQNEGSTSCTLPKDSTRGPCSFTHRAMSNIAKLNSGRIKENRFISIDTHLGIDKSDLGATQRLQAILEKVPITPSTQQSSNLDNSAPNILHVSPRQVFENKETGCTSSSLPQKSPSLPKTKQNLVIKKSQIVQKKKVPQMLPSPHLGSKSFRLSQALNSDINSGKTSKLKKSIDFLYRSTEQSSCSHSFRTPKNYPSRLFNPPSLTQRNAEKHFRQIMKFSATEELLNSKFMKQRNKSPQEHRKKLRVTFELPSI